jgi:CubicO group peptidase (beta-lactamase class C family)
MQLAADHVIDLDRTIQSYLPGLLPDRYQPITIRELLNMTSGLPQIDEGAPAQTADQVIAAGSPTRPSTRSSRTRYGRMGGPGHVRTSSRARSSSTTR